MKLNSFIHDHINQIAMIVTFAVMYFTRDLTVTAITGGVCAVGAWLVKSIVPVQKP